MRTQRLLTGLVIEPATTAVMVTNTSGGPLSVSVWDMTMVGSIALATGAAPSASTFTITIDGIVVCQYNIVVDAVGTSVTAPFHHNGGGQQFLLANTHTINVNQQVSPNCFVRCGASLAVDFVSGT